MSPRLASARLVAQMERKIEEHFFGDTANILQDTRTSFDGFGQPVNTTTTTAVPNPFANMVVSSDANVSVEDQK